MHRRKVRESRGRTGGCGGLDRLPLNPGVCPSGSISESSSIFAGQGEPPPWAERACFVGGEEGGDMGGDSMSLFEIKGWLSWWPQPGPVLSSSGLCLLVGASQNEE